MWMDFKTVMLTEEDPKGCSYSYKVLLVIKLIDRKIDGRYLGIVVEDVK